ncbi:MAG TPA: MarR family transcriptional regulator [Thermoleophilia bacterium]|nr:MarR family transcriptional regulator [Thermoleophilia bacterium]
MAKKSKDKDKTSKKERKKALRAAAEAEAVEGGGDAELGLITAANTPPRAIVGATELAARLASLATVLRRSLARGDTGDGLTRARLSALALLVLGGPRTLGDLAAAERVRPPTMTRLVHAMEADGLVAREPHPSDGRSIIIRATSRGERQLEIGRARQIRPLAEAITALERGERRQLEDAADLLGRVLRDTEREPVEAADRGQPGSSTLS